MTGEAASRARTDSHMASQADDDSLTVELRPILEHVLDDVVGVRVEGKRGDRGVDLFE